MNIPKTIKIGGHTLNINITDDTRVIPDNEIGNTTLAKNTINLNSAYPQSRREEALLHETIHNCFYDLGLDQDEDIVTRIASSLYQVIVDNPKIFKCS